MHENNKYYFISKYIVHRSHGYSSKQRVRVTYDSYTNTIQLQDSFIHLHWRIYIQNFPVHTLHKHFHQKNAHARGPQHSKMGPSPHMENPGSP